MLNRLTYLFISSLLLASPMVQAEKHVSPETVEGSTTVSTAEAKTLFDQGAVFVDVRSDQDWEAGRIPGSRHLELKKVFSQESLSEIAQPDQKLVIYCNSTGCMRSSQACQKAVEWGYKQVYYYRLGYPDWQNDGYAIE